MKIIEEIQLKNIINTINEFNLNKNNDFKNIYNDLNNLNLESLKDISFKNDIEFFDNVSFVLSVISSIINHPHIITKSDDIIVRSELAGHIDEDSLKRVFKESSLWKQKEYDMIPEYVYYHQQEDNIKIYENIFIGMLIKLLDEKINEYYNFYIDILPSKEENNILDDKFILNGLNKIENILRKLRYIKNSSFYKIISKCDISRKQINPTNILLKDRLYNYCFKFYRKFVIYEDDFILKNDFNQYYFYLLLKSLNKNKFVLINKLDINNLSFKLNEIKINLINQLDKFILNINYKNLNINHVLYLNLDRTIKDLPINNNIYKTADIITLWNLYEINNELTNQVFKKLMSEFDMICYWLNSKFDFVKANKDLYQKFCPVCKSKNINVNNDLLYKCDKCNTEYLFTNIDQIWFIKIRRVNNGK